MEGHQGSRPQSLAAVSKEPVCKEERDPNQEDPKKKRDDPAGKLHIGNRKMEQRNEEGIHGREDIVQAFSKKAFRELVRDGCVPDTIHFDARGLKGQKEPKCTTGANYRRQ